jgi:hypothetical protein
MSKLNGNQVLSFVVYAAMLLLSLSFVVGAFVYPGRLRLVPLVIGIPTVLLLVYITLLEIKPEVFTIGRRKPEDGGPPPMATASGINAGQWQRVVTIYGWLVGFFVGVLVFGYYIATPVFLVAFFIKESGLKPMRAVLVTVGVSVLFLLMFYVLLDIPLWPGILPRIIPHIIGGGSLPPLYRGL